MGFGHELAFCAIFTKQATADFSVSQFSSVPDEIFPRKFWLEKSWPVLHKSNFLSISSKKMIMKRKMKNENERVQFVNHHAQLYTYVLSLCLSLCRFKKTTFVCKREISEHIYRSQMIEKMSNTRCHTMIIVLQLSRDASNSKLKKNLQSLIVAKEKKQLKDY